MASESPPDGRFMASFTNCRGLRVMRFGGTLRIALPIVTSVTSGYDLRNHVTKGVTMGRDRAAYMRDYRAREKTTHAAYDEAKPLIGQLKTRVTELEEEVRHLKAELAQRRPTERGEDYYVAPSHAFGHPRPAPKRR